MKLILTLMVVWSFSFTTVANENCTTDEEGVTTCKEDLLENTNKVVHCGKEDTSAIPGLNQLLEHEKFAQSNIMNPPLKFCDKNMSLNGEKLTKKQRNKRIRKLNRQCRKKAREYKRSVAKKLFKKLKFKQAIQALLNSSKKISNTKKVRSRFGTRWRNTKKTKLDLQLLAEDVEGVTAEEFSGNLIKKIREMYPEIDKLTAMAKNPKGAFTGSFDQKESYPINVLVKTKKGQSCMMKSPDLPKHEEPKIDDCYSCSNPEQQNNFTNDCSYMVNSSIKIGKKNLTEAYARELAGGSF